MSRHDGRAPNELRPVNITPGFMRSATGSASRSRSASTRPSVAAL